MRAYELTLTNAAGKTLALHPNGFAASSTNQPTFSSRVKNPNGNGTINNPGALNIEFDIPIANAATPQGNFSIRVWGIGLRQLAAGSGAQLNPNFATGANGAGFKLNAGMAKGLPLATAAAGQYGLIAQGSIFQAFGNWQGINQSLDLVVQPIAYSPDGGGTFTWAPNQALSVALIQCLNKAYPGYKVVTPMPILSTLTQSFSTVNVSHLFTSLSQLASMINEQTQQIGTQLTGNPYYPGVNIAVKGNSILCYDGTVKAIPTQLNFQDLIGQPTWLESTTLTCKTVLRSDLALGSQVTLPKGLPPDYALVSPAAAIPGSPVRQALAFAGTFVVTEIHHYANFRQPDGDSWATVMSLTPILQAAS